MSHNLFEQLARYIDFFNAPGESKAAQVAAEEIEFKDPFHQIRGREALLRHLLESHRTTGGMHFSPLTTDWSENRCWLRWKFSARLRGKKWQFEGVSELVFDEAGRVIRHTDYWDSGRHFYAHLPLLGPLIGWVLRRLGGEPRKPL